MDAGFYLLYSKTLSAVRIRHHHVRKQPDEVDLLHIVYIDRPLRRTARSYADVIGDDQKLLF